MTATVASEVLREGDKIRINSKPTTFVVTGSGHTLVHLRDPSGKTLYLTRGPCSTCPWQITSGIQSFGSVTSIQVIR